MQQAPPPGESRSTKAKPTGSALAGVGRFVISHPAGVAQMVALALIAIVILQNLEPTSIDVLFWSFASFPKLLVIVFSMVIGAAIWELARRYFRL